MSEVPKMSADLCASYSVRAGLITSCKWNPRIPLGIPQGWHHYIQVLYIPWHIRFIPLMIRGITVWHVSSGLPVSSAIRPFYYTGNGMEDQADSSSCKYYCGDGGTPAGVKAPTGASQGAWTSSTWAKTPPAFYLIRGLKIKKENRQPSVKVVYSPDINFENRVVA